MSRCLAALVMLVMAPFLHAGESDKYLPADTELVVRLQVRRLLEAPAVKNDKDALERAKKIVAQLLSDYQPALQHLEAAGVQLYRDIEILTAGLPEDADAEKVFVVIDGKFDPAKFATAAAAAAKKADSGLKIIQLAGRDVYELKLPGLDQPVFACLVDGATLLATSRKDDLAAALSKTKEKAAPPKKVQAVLALLDPKQHLGFAGTRPATVKLLEMFQLPFSDALPALLESADTVHGGLTVNKEVDFTMHFTTRDEKTARQFFQQMTIVVAVARGAIAKEAKEDKRFVPLVELMKTLRTGVDGSAVVWRAQLPLASAEQLLNGFKPQ